MDDKKWKELVAKSVKVLINPKINLEDNHLTINAVFPFWREFISTFAKISHADLYTWHRLNSPDQQCLFIQGLYPDYKIQIFWAQAMKLVLKIRIGGQNKEEL